MLDRCASEMEYDENEDNRTLAESQGKRLDGSRRKKDVFRFQDGFSSKTYFNCLLHIVRVNSFGSLFSKGRLDEEVFCD